MSAASFVKRFDIELDLKRPGADNDCSVVDGDTGNVIYIKLTDAGVPVSVEGKRIIAAFSNSRGKYMQDSAETDGGISISEDNIKLQLRPQSFAPGVVECELQIYSNAAETAAAGTVVYGSLVTTAKFNFSCRGAIYDKAAIESETAAPPLSAVLAAIGAAEAERTAGENLRAAEESKRAAAEKSRAASEKSRNLSETARGNAESSRRTAEAARAKAETARDDNEAARKQNEAVRSSAENDRLSSESKRASAESERIAAEKQRILNENSRKAAETGRAAAEAARSKIFHGDISYSTDAAHRDNPIDFAVESGWYFFRGGILVVSSTVSGNASDEYGSIEQALLMPNGKITHRTGTVTSGVKSWSEWN